jgi:hypothetical protein
VPPFIGRTKFHPGAAVISLMSATILDAIDGIITVDIAGQIDPTELEGLQAGILYHLLVWGGGSILCHCMEFEGWTAGGPGDPSYQTQLAPLIHKLAVLGKSEWEILASAFIGDGGRPFPVACFESGRVPEARAWLRG